MLNKIANTFYTSVFTAGIGFLILVITTHYLGSTGRGSIGLLMVNIGIAQIFCAIVGSATLVYMVPRYSLNGLLFLTTIWALASSIFISMLLAIFNKLSSDMFYHTAILSFLAAIIANNHKVLIARDEIIRYNFLRIFQSIANLLVIIFLINSLTFSKYISALYLSYALTSIASTVFVFKGFRAKRFENINEPLKIFIRMGTLNQFTNLIQLGNYRFSFYLLNAFSGIKTLGLFSLGINLIETVSIFQSSINTIHYGEVSRQKNDLDALKNNLKLVKLSLLGTLAIVICAALLPLKYYLIVFGSEFNQVKQIMLLLSPGVIALSAGAIIAHYFSGIGKVHYNTYSSSAGFLVIIVAGISLIPTYGIYGAAIANSLSYITTSGVIFWQYRKHLQNKSIFSSRID